MALKIVILSGTNPYSNSGIYSLDLFKCLKAYGYEVVLVTKLYDSRFEDGIFSIYGKNTSILLTYYKKIKNKLSIIKKSRNFYMHSLEEKQNYIKSSKIFKLIKFQPDLFIHLFPHDFLNAKNLYEINKKTNAPICIAPVDIGTLTGGCHYANDCQGFTNNCGKCPGLFSKNSKDITYQNLKFKKKYLSKTNLFCIANTWTIEQLNQSSIFKNRKKYLSHVVINEKQFYPGDKYLAKKTYSIEEHKIVLFFGASYLSERRKGLIYLIQALELLFSELSEIDRKDIIVAIAGNLEQTNELKSLIKFDTKFLGTLSFERLREAFQMAELFISPSVQDAGPMMVIQSMMCGTPVVTFKMGNSIDFIEEGVTGYQANIFDVMHLKEGIKKVIYATAKEKNEFIINCRNKALNKASYFSFADNFTNIYNDFSSIKSL